MWVRGLKPSHAVNIAYVLTESHPMWVRGLKQCQHHKRSNKGGVAPHVGAWIETTRSLMLPLA